MLRSLARFSGPESLGHTQSLADFITTMSGFRFSVHTGPLIAGKFIKTDHWNYVSVTKIVSAWVLALV